jgi:nifR3 family TIM-barrel protein
MHRSELLRRHLSASPLLPAPMCGYSDRPFRDLLREMGACLVYTEMLSAEAIVRGDKTTWELMDFRGEPPPVAVQIFGFRPPVMAEAAAVVERQGASVVDLNLGCPARKIVRSDCGAALLEDPERVRDIFRSVRRSVRGPLTAKMRWHPDERKLLEVARICEGEGADALTLHARTPGQGFTGRAQWEWIARLKDVLTIPVIGNGDVTTVDDMARMRAQTGCDAVMVGRGIVGNPWLMRDALEFLRRADEAESAAWIPAPPPLEERLRVLYRHAELMLHYRGPHGLIEFRKHSAGYLRAVPGARSARPDLMQVTSLDQLGTVLRTHFGAAARHLS